MNGNNLHIATKTCGDRSWNHYLNVGIPASKTWQKLFWCSPARGWPMPCSHMRHPRSSQWPLGKTPAPRQAGKVSCGSESWKPHSLLHGKVLNSEPHLVISWFDSSNFEPNPHYIMILSKIPLNQCIGWGEHLQETMDIPWFSHDKKGKFLDFPLKPIHCLNSASSCRATVISNSRMSRESSYVAKKNQRRMRQTLPMIQHYVY